MTTTITATTSATTTTPTAVLTRGWDRVGRNIVHDPISRTEPDVTLRPASTRSGRLDLFYELEADAVAADAMHRAADTFALVDTDAGYKDMTYVVDGAGGRVQLERLLPHARWVVRVPYREVSA